jgi:hypothetical protein
LETNFYFIWAPPKNAEILPWLYSWKTIVQLGHPKNVQTPPSNPQPTTIFYFLFLFAHQNKYEKLLLGDAKKIKITTLIAFVIRFSLLFQVQKKTQNIWKDNFTAIDVNSEELESDEYPSGC